MPETVRLSSDRRIIEVDSFGEVSHSDLDASMIEVRRLAEEHGSVRVLVDARGETALPRTLALYQFGEGFPISLKFAVLFSEQQATSEELRFLETVARNRGSDFRLFGSKDEALRWLG